MVLSSASFRMVSEMCLATQSCIKKVVQEGAKSTSLWDACVYGVDRLHFLGSASRKVKYPVAQVGFQAYAVMLSDKLGNTASNAEQ